MKRNEKISVDIPPVDPRLAMQLMIHHLGIAAAMFEVTEESGDSAVRVDLENYLGSLDMFHMQKASLAFFDEMVKEYARMK